MIRLCAAEFATVSQLFKYKAEANLNLEPFPGYSDDQWGIKAHNRPWIQDVGDFKPGQKIIEVGGAYSSLPRFLSEKYNLEAWIGDDFGGYTHEQIWTRWGDPKELPVKYPKTKYVFQPFGIFSEAYPDKHFDRVFSVSTLEHIPDNFRVKVFQDMNRCMAKGGMQIHSIDISVPMLSGLGKYHIIGDKKPYLRKVANRFLSESAKWFDIIRQSGVQIDVKVPEAIQLYDRSVLVESADVVYRLYPPVNAPKPYYAAASLLLIIKND